MPKIDDNYAKQYIATPTVGTDYMAYYFKMARQLGDVAEHYNRSFTDDIFQGYSELARRIESLAMLYKKEKGETEISMAKASIHEDFNRLILDLEDYFSSYPDEICQRDISNGKLLALSFSIRL